MPHFTLNLWRHEGLGQDLPSTNSGIVSAFLTRCPAHGQTPLRSVPKLAERIGVVTAWPASGACRK